ncbi:MAG TPA: 23S rRNA (guanosine(2251)-2'-O)-methyltransferase RlmB, partial [Chloroflexota bacterium]
MTSDDVWIWGRHPVLEALRADRVREIRVARGNAPSEILRDIAGEAHKRGVRIQEVDLKELEALAPGGRTQGGSARVMVPRLLDIPDLLKLTSSRPEPPFLLALDQIQDPHNLGALLRTAEAAGVQAVVVPERRSAPLSGTVARVSAGASVHVPVLAVKNFARALDEIREANIWVAGLDSSAERSIYETDFAIPLLLVVGGESSGLRHLTREHCDLL